MQFEKDTKHQDENGDGFDYEQLYFREKLKNDKLCAGLPMAFLSYMNYVRNLEFDEAPDYKRCRQYFDDLYEHKNFAHDFVFEWHVFKEKTLKDKEKAEQEAIQKRE